MNLQPSDLKTFENIRNVGNRIWYNSEYRQVEVEQHDSRKSSDSDNDTEEDDLYKDDYDEESEEDTDQLTENDKYLIFTTGLKTYTPHQIGILF